MKRSWKVLGGFFLAVLLSVPAWSAAPPQPGTINYIEGQAQLDNETLTDEAVGSVRLEAGQSVTTQNGRAEILLAPGIFFRLDRDSSAQMINPGLADTILKLKSGRASVEVAEIRPENNVRIEQGIAETRLLKPGLYDFDAGAGQIRVFDGKAQVRSGDRSIELKGGHELALQASSKLKARKFDKAESDDDFYRWASLRSSYLAEASVDQARTYIGDGGWGPGWYGSGWYWDPGFRAYTFIPADGIFYGPFGWGFYSPFYVSYAPYFGYGFGGYAHRFGPYYRPFYSAGASHSFHSGVRPGVMGGRSFGRSAAGFGGRTGGFGRSGGFHGGGFGGFHGGGGHR